MRIRIWISLLLIWSVQLVQAQFHQEGQRVELLLSNGKSVKGTITEHTDTQISIQSSKATRTYEKSDIKHIEYLDAVETSPEDNEYLTIAMQDYQMAVPNALAAREGLSYRNIALVGNQFSYGFNKNWTLQFGFELLTSAFIDSGDPILYLAPKYSFSLADQWTGALSVATFKWDKDIVLVPISTVTYGSTKHNVSAGFGFAANYEDNDEILPYLAFTTSMSKTISFVGEIYLKPVFVTAAIRIRLGKASSLDFTYVPGASFPIPTLSLAF